MSHDQIVHAATIRVTSTLHNREQLERLLVLPEYQRYAAEMTCARLSRPPGSLRLDTAYGAAFIDRGQEIDILVQAEENEMVSRRQQATAIYAAMRLALLKAGARIEVIEPFSPFAGAVRNGAARMNLLATEQMPPRPDGKPRKDWRGARDATGRFERSGAEVARNLCLEFSPEKRATQVVGIMGLLLVKELWLYRPDVTIEPAESFRTQAGFTKGLALTPDGLVEQAVAVLAPGDASLCRTRLAIRAARGVPAGDGIDSREILAIFGCGQSPVTNAIFHDDRPRDEIMEAPNSGLFLR